MDSAREEDPRGRLTRPYTLTRGRTKASADIAIEAVLVTTARGREEAPFAGRDKQLIADLCHDRPLSLAEIAAHLRITLGVAQILVADMTGEGMLDLHDTAVGDSYHEHLDLLERVLSGLHKL